MLPHASMHTSALNFSARAPLHRRYYRPNSLPACAFRERTMHARDRYVLHTHAGRKIRVKTIRGPPTSKNFDDQMYFFRSCLKRTCLLRRLRFLKIKRVKLKKNFQNGGISSPPRITRPLWCFETEAALLLGEWRDGTRVWNDLNGAVLADFNRGISRYYAEMSVADV